MTRSANRLDLKQIEIFVVEIKKKMVLEKSLSTKEDLWTTI